LLVGRRSIFGFWRVFRREDSTSVRRTTEKPTKPKRQGVGFCGNRLTITMNFDVITLFPEMFTALNYGVVGRAISNNIAKLRLINPRDYSTDKNRRVDERPYGGGPGMVMMAEPLSMAIKEAKKSNNAAKTVLLTPQGKLLNQNGVKALKESKHIILVVGRYEGIDERLVTEDIDEEWSIGDYVLSGGELAAMVLIDAIVRLLPNVLGDEDSAVQDSFMDGLLDCPHYTRPERFNGQNVPNVLLSGNHKKIFRWRLQQKLGRTFLRRPDLLEKRKWTANEESLLMEFLGEK
jgi:tRNA (guanine37-N1)-methyltransferase